MEILSLVGLTMISTVENHRTSALPLTAALFCVLWSLVFDVNIATHSHTHCKVYDFLPTISGAVGKLRPQSYVWRIAIALHDPQRLMIARAYYSFHLSVPVARCNQAYRTLAAVACLLNCVEILSLVGLTMVSTVENLQVHVNLFLSFVVCSQASMLLTILLMRRSRLAKNRTPAMQELMSLWYKTRLLIVNVSAFAACVYLFYRHMTYCEPGVLSLFAALEYVIVLTNVAFHSTVYWDFGHDFVLAVVHAHLLSEDSVQ